jgi:hypothetical protein
MKVPVFSFLSEDFLTLLFENQKNTIICLLNQYTNYSEGRGKVYDCQIQGNSIFVDGNGGGKFTVDYRVQYFFGCEDVTTEHDQRMVVGFKQDLQDGTVELKGEYWPERDPGD